MRAENIIPTDRSAERSALIDDLMGQRIVAGDIDLAAALAHDATVTSYRKGEDLLTEGEETDHMVFVFSGAVEIVIGANVVATIPGSCLVGEMALFQSQPRRSATVRAAELTICAELSAAKFKALAKIYPLALQRMIDIIKERDPNAAVTLAEH